MRKRYSRDKKRTCLRPRVVGVQVVTGRRLGDSESEIDRSCEVRRVEVSGKTGDDPVCPPTSLGGPPEG